MRARFLVAVGFLAFLPRMGSPATIDVAPGPGTPLQDALAAAAPGDTLRLSAGTFSEAIVVDKAVRIRGRIPTATASTTIDAQCAAPHAIDVRAAGVRVEFVTVQGGTEGGVRVKDVEDVKLKHVRALAFRSVPGVHCGSELYGFDLDNVRRVQVYACSAVGTYWEGDQSYYLFGVAGLRLAGLGANSRVKVKRSFSMTNPVGILVQNTRGPGIAIVKNETDGLAIGILLGDTQGVTVSRNGVRDADANGPQAGIQLDPTSSGNLVSGNLIRGAVADVLDEGSGNCWKRNDFQTGTLPADNCS